MNKNTFATNDLPLAASLVSFGCDFQGIEDAGNRCQFLFKNPPACEKIAASYWKDELKVSPMHFYAAIRLLKRALFNQERPS